MAMDVDEARTEHPEPSIDTFSSLDAAKIGSKRKDPPFAHRDLPHPGGAPSAIDYGAIGE